MKRFALFISDLAMLYAALVLTLTFRYGDSFAHQHALHLPPFLTIFALWLLVFYIVNLYEPQHLRNNIDFYSTLFRASIAASVLSVLFFYFIPIYGITPKTNLFIFIGIFTVLEAANRSLFNYTVQQRFKRSVLIIGQGPQARELAEYIQNNPQLGYYLFGMVQLDAHLATLASDQVKIFSGIDQLKLLIPTKKIHYIIVSPEAYQDPNLIDTLYRLLEYGIPIRNLSSFYEQITGRVPLGAINQVWFLENISEGSKRIYELAKRIGDLVMVVVTGIPFLLMLPFLALAIRLDSRGPVFFKQKRVGKLGKPFIIVKLRTMRQDAEKNTGAVWAQENDPRVTRIGKFLRKSRLDELPQLWNILKNEMSFVGPRAERPEFHETLTREIPFYEERYLIKPGAAGWAQLQYRYGASVEDTREKLQYDLYYIKNRSLLLDLGILLRTINTALRQAGR